MPIIKFSEVLAFSSEDNNHPAENLLKPDSYLKWKSKVGHNEKQEFVCLKFEKLSSINSIDIGNEHSAFVEVLVSRDGKDFEVLLVASSFMTPLESRNSTSVSRVRMFGKEKLNTQTVEEKWDRIKVICTQPFNKKVQYGLTFLKLYSPDNPKTKLGQFVLNEDSEDDSIDVGSFFAKHRESSSPLTGPAAIRAASKQAKTPESRNMNKKSEEQNAPQMEFYQLKKKQDSPKPIQKSPPKSIEKTKEGSRERAQTSKAESKPNKAESKTNKAESKTNKEESKTKKADTKTNKAENTSKTEKKFKPFNKLMDNVVFVLSGYQNPLRSQLRDSLVSMGATYKGDWSSNCTHLICAFKNTPKYRSVKGKGKIVSEKWVQECHSKKIRYPWRRFALDSNDGDESEDEVWASEIRPETSGKVKGSVGDSSPTRNSGDSSEDTDTEIERFMKKRKASESPPKKQSPRKISKTAEKVSNSDQEYDADTDIDEDVKKRKDTDHLPLPKLSSVLEGRTFFLYGSTRGAKRKSLNQYVVALGGEISEYMSEDVNFVLTDDPWDETFDEALEENGSLQFVKTQWIWDCYNKNKFVPPQPHLIVPNSKDQ